MQTIHFGTKEENNQRREEEFLKLSPSERVIRFLQLSQTIAGLEQGQIKKNKGNFILTK